MFLSLFLIILAAVIGAVGALYYLGKTIIDDRKKNQKGSRYIVKFYINMVVKNKKDVIKDEMKKTIQGKTKRKTNFASKLATKLVHKAVSKESFNKELVHEVAAAVEDDFAEENIAAEGYVVYIQDLFSVIGVDVKAVDVKGILCKELGLSSSLYDTIMGLVQKCFGKEFAEYALGTQMLETVTAEIVAGVGPEIVSDLAQEGIDVDVVVKSAADQAPFFYALTKPNDEGIKEPINSWKMQAIHNGQWQGKTFKSAGQ